MQSPAPSPDSPPPELAPADPPTRIPLRFEDWLSVAIMALLALITFSNVLVRYFTSISFAWTEEISIFLMVVLTLVAGSAAFARNRHVRIELLAERGSTGRRRALARFGSAMVIVLFAMMTLLGSLMVWDAYEFGETSPGIGVPQWWYTIWLPVCSALITLRAMGLFHRQSRAGSSGPNEHTPAMAASPMAASPMAASPALSPASPSAGPRPPAAPEPPRS